MFQDPSNLPDELAQNVSKKKNPRRTIYSSIFLRKFRIWPFLNYLHDSNSIFWAQGIKSEGVFGRTVLIAEQLWAKTNAILEAARPLLTQLQLVYGSNIANSTPEATMYRPKPTSAANTDHHGAADIAKKHRQTPTNFLRSSALSLVRLCHPGTIPFRDGTCV